MFPDRMLKLEVSYIDHLKIFGAMNGYLGGA